MRPQVVHALEPWSKAHSKEELLQVLPNLRLAWIPAKELSAAMASLMQDSGEHDTVQRLVGEAFEAQLHSKKRAREEAVPDQFICSITQDVRCHSGVHNDHVIDWWVADNERPCVCK